MLLFSGKGNINYKLPDGLFVSYMKEVVNHSLDYPLLCVNQAGSAECKNKLNRDFVMIAHTIIIFSFHS